MTLKCKRYLRYLYDNLFGIFSMLCSVIYTTKFCSPYTYTNPFKHITHIYMYNLYKISQFVYLCMYWWRPEEQRDIIHYAFWCRLLHKKLYVPCSPSKCISKLFFNPLKFAFVSVEQLNHIAWNNVFPFYIIL